MRIKKILAACAVVSLLPAAFLGGCSKSEEKAVSVQSVAMLMDVQTGQINRYGGIVVSQSEKTIQRDETKTIDEVLVKEGDLVEEGQILLTYDLANMNLTVQKAELELEQLRNSVTTYGEQIAQLEKEKAAAPSSEQLAYTVQIQEAVLSRKEAEYNITVKEAELENLRRSLDKNEVTSPVTGRIQSLNLEGGTDNNGQPLPLVTIVESGAYRVKGTVNEMNRGEFMEGTPVIIRSRVDDTQIWTGTVDYINWNEPEKDNGNNGMYDEAASDLSTGSNYPFYITMDSVDGLILGQHVYIEPDYGQAQGTDGIWLEDGYLVQEDGTAYVWAASSRSLLEKKTVITGEHDEEMGMTQIVSGLTLDDYIAWPQKDLKAGMHVVYFDEESFETAADRLQDEGDGAEDMQEEEFYEEEYMEEEFQQDDVYDEEIPEGEIYQEGPEG